MEDPPPDPIAGVPIAGLPGQPAPGLPPNLATLYPVPGSMGQPDPMAAELAGLPIDTMGFDWQAQLRRRLLGYAG